MNHAAAWNWRGLAPWRSLTPWRWLLPLALLAAIWWPEWSHFRIDRSDADPALLAAAATQPADAVLDELAGVDLAEIEGLSLPVMSIAANAAQGFVDIPGLSGGRVALRGHPQDHQNGPPTFRLFMAGLSLERLLLKAYEQTRDERWLMLALERTAALAAYERAQRHDLGFLWNDHAVAARGATLIRLWADVRQRPALREAHGPWLQSFAQRSGRMLAKPVHFTVRTNHGVMQNLALLQLAAAFPALPEAPQWRTLARERLALQLGFYVSPEGVVLEHSAGYHQVGTVLLQRAQRLYRLNGLPADPALDRAAAAAHQVLAQLMRPDATLPPLGNTEVGFAYRRPMPGADGSAPLGWTPPPPATAAAGATLYPAAGWAVWWSGEVLPRESQVMLTWAKHDGHGHKHADEGALVWWAHGQQWLGAIGYWPYGDPLVRAAYGWPSANAPHAPGEDARAPRSVALLASGDAAGLRLLDTERRTPEGMVLRRQVLQWDGSSLLVLDFASGAARGTRSLWTLGPPLKLEPAAAGSRSAVTAPTADGRRLAIGVTSTGPVQTERLRGSRDPFGGWMSVDRQPQPVDAWQVTNPAPESTTVTLFQLGTTPLAPQIAPMPARLDPQDWQLDITLADGAPLRITRRGLDLTLAAPNAPARRLALQPPPASLAPALQALRRNYAEAIAAYPPWRDLWRFRVLVSQRIGMLAGGIEAVALVLALGAGAFWRRWRVGAHAALFASWVLLGAYVLLVYLKA